MSSSLVLKNFVLLDGIGTLEEGKVADLIVVRGNPLEDLRILADRRNINLVIKDGQIVAWQCSTDAYEVPASAMAGAWIYCGLPEHG